MEDLLIFPFGGNARESLVAMRSINGLEPQWNVIGFIDDDKKYWGQEHFGFKVLGGRQALADYPFSKILAVPGNPRNFLNRKKTIEALNLTLDRFANVIDPTAVISPDAKIGRNTLLMANVVISSAAKIGNHCIVLPNTVISHESCVADYALIGSNVSISGSCSIGYNSYIGSGVKIKDNTKIGSRCLVGIGSCVINDVSDKTVVVGNPARYLKEIG